MSKQLRELQARKATLVKDARALTDIAAAEQRDMNDEEVAAFEALKAKIEATSAAIDREAALIIEEAQMNHPSQLTTASVITVVDNAASDPKHGFKSVGDFLKTVRQAQNPGASIDERLLIGSGRNAVAPASFGSEGSAQDGGFLVPPQFAQEIFQLSLGEDSLLPMTDNVEITGNTMPAANYTVDSACEPARITPVFGQIWPIALPQIGAVSVIFDAGYGNASAVPEGIKTWIKLRVGSLYVHREEVASMTRGRIDPLPFIDGLLDPYKVPLI